LLTVNQKNLESKGRLQYFFHSPSSELPIRDILNEQKQGNKTEPHIEIGAENYWHECYQSNNIIPFLESNEKYLFLFTTCRNRNLKEFYGKKFVVGFIKKMFTGISPKHKKSNCQKDESGPKKYVKGEIYLYGFSDSISLDELGFDKDTRVHKIDVDMTSLILNHFDNKTNILENCIEEIKRLDFENLTCYREKYGFQCQFKEECKRFN